MSNQQKNFIIKFFIGLFLLLFVLTLFMYNHNKNTVVIGTKNLTEQKIVASMLEEVIERDTDLEVDVKPGMDSTSFVHSAIIRNDIDMYVEYSSVSFLEIFKQEYTGQASEEILDYIKKHYESEYDLEWIATLGFDNSNVLVCNDFCKENNIEKYSDLTEQNFTFGAPAYFYERSDGYNLLEDAYDYLDNVKIKKLDAVLVYVALEASDIDVGLGFTTDAKLANTDFTLLEDDKHVFPKYDAGIVVSKKSLEKHKELKDILVSFNDVLTNDIISEANEQVVVEEVPVEEVAHNLVVDLGL